jgi:hypothetical protein
MMGISPVDLDKVDEIDSNLSGNRNRTVTLTKEEHDKLVELYERAQTTPVIALSVADGLAGRDFATLAWNRVQEYMDKLGAKYLYEPTKARISMDSPTFEVE